ncbi:MAG: DapH/DapD/GlmU-related protein [Mycobacteriales bacterium]|nr:DapH/DapD/GlmU-related protein [Mycobacteriales bacterium]
MPITSRMDYREHLRRDAAAHGLDRVRPGALLTRPQLAFQRRLRAAEWASNCWPGPWGRAGAALLRYRLLRAGTRLGFTVPVNTTGPGLCLAHVGTVVVSRKAQVGADVRIHAGVNIGESDGRAAVVGDGCYLGPGAQLVGGIELGPGCVVGAGAVVTRSFAAGTVLVGVPARALR